MTSIALLALTPPKIAYLSILPVLVMLGGAVAILAVSSLQRRRMEPSVATAMLAATAAAWVSAG